MDARSLFDVATRAMGLWQILFGMDDVAHFVNANARLYEPFHESPYAMLSLGLVHLLAGFFLLFSAASVVKAVYGEPTEPTAKEETADRLKSDEAEGI